MSLTVKICGLNSQASLEAAIDGGASMVGFVFYARSPRALEPKQAAQLGATVPKNVKRVGLVVDEDDARIGAILKSCPLELLQLHGEETPDRCREIRTRHGLRLIKAIKLGQASDLGAIDTYGGAVDFLLFDAKAPASRPDALPGGNALSFDWSMLKGRQFPLPWLLSGGLSVLNLAQAVAETGARMVDVSSGVEDKPGVKSPSKIMEFLDLAQGLGGG